MQQVKKWGKRLLFLLPALVALLMFWLLPLMPQVTETVFSGMEASLPNQSLRDRLRVDDEQIRTFIAIMREVFVL